MPNLHEVTSRSGPEPDAVCAAAVAVAEGAAREVADRGGVGAHLGAVAEGQRTVAHTFECLAPGYRGWRWSVTLARAPRARHATVSEVVLLPGPDAVLAPSWVPWADRLMPGDLGSGDALPYRPDDPYLEPGYVPLGDDIEDEIALWELGLGRVRVLSAAGRDAAVDRWYGGGRGPGAEEAAGASAACATCGYWLRLAGGLRQLFGVCAHEWSPSDGRVVSADHGCGAHSETDVERAEPQPPPAPILDETGHESVVLPPRSPSPADGAADDPTDGAADDPTDGAADVPVDDVADDPTDGAPDDPVDDADGSAEIVPEVPAQAVES